MYIPHRVDMLCFCSNQEQVDNDQKDFFQQKTVPPALMECLISTLDYPYSSMYMNMYVGAYSVKSYSPAY